MQGLRPMKDVFFFFWHSMWILTLTRHLLRGRKKKEKQGAAKEKNKWRTLCSLLAFHVRTVALSAPFKLSPKTGAKTEGDKTWPPNAPADSMCFIGGRVGVKARDSVVICMVLRCNCSISNNVVRLLVQIREEVVIVEELTERHWLTSRCCKQWINVAKGWWAEVDLW